MDCINFWSFFSWWKCSCYKGFHSFSETVESFMASKAGHPSLSTLQQLLKHHIKAHSTPVQFYSTCPLGKHHALPFPVSSSCTSNVLDLIQTDAWGPALITPNEGFNYYIHFIE
ncbi:hypothetical protein Syun_027198 [Stephania yunnanensis]|uniref:Uncharacterized protein n=1 Tax=Stephania yunnanensis TaxID=152371 RepID=A0AAP0EIJ3_9MAGN